MHPWIVLLLFLSGLFEGGLCFLNGFPMEQCDDMDPTKIKIEGSSAKGGSAGSEPDFNNTDGLTEDALPTSLQLSDSLNLYRIVTSPHKYRRGRVLDRNLGPDCTEALLYQKFAPVGNLHNIRLCKDKATGRCLGYGFINYVSKSDAQNALSTLNYTLLQNRTIRLMWAEKNIKNLPPSANIFIKNLDLDIDEKVLHDIFSNYGNILSLKLATDENGASKGFAFIQYQDDKSAEEAIKRINEKMLKGKVVYVNKFMPRDKRLSSNPLHYQNVYIKNFDSDIKDTDLVEMCSKFGEIVSAKVMLDNEGNSKCFGFVSFETAESAREAVRELNGKTFNGRRLFADRAKRKAERQKEVLESLKHRFQGIERNIKSV